MLAFEIWKNGKKVAVAGLRRSGAVSFMLTWVGKGEDASAKAVEGSEIDGLALRVGGIDTSDPSGDQSIEWIEDTALRLGADIQIRCWRGKRAIVSRLARSAAACACTSLARFRRTRKGHLH